jgi:hypothetical protein
VSWANSLVFPSRIVDVFVASCGLDEKWPLLVTVFCFSFLVIIYIVTDVTNQIKASILVEIAILVVPFCK